MGILYLCIILYAVAIPIGGRFETGDFFTSYAASPVLMNFLWAVMAAVSLLSLSVIPSISRLLGEENDEWIAAAHHFGIAGSIVSAAGFLTMLGSAPGLAQAYREGDPFVRAAINAVGLPQLDPYHVLALGGMGIWFLIINSTALRRNTFPVFHACLGILLGIFLWAAVLAAIIDCGLLDLIASAVGGLCAPIWYFLTAGKLVPTKQNAGGENPRPGVPCAYSAPG